MAASGTAPCPLLSLANRRCCANATELVAAIPINQLCGASGNGNQIISHDAKQTTQTRPSCPLWCRTITRHTLRSHRFSLPAPDGNRIARCPIRVRLHGSSPRVVDQQLSVAKPEPHFRADHASGVSILNQREVTRCCQHCKRGSVGLLMVLGLRNVRGERILHE